MFHIELLLFATSFLTRINVLNSEEIDLSVVIAHVRHAQYVNQTRVEKQLYSAMKAFSKITQHVIARQAHDVTGIAGDDETRYSLLKVPHGETSKRYFRKSRNLLGYCIHVLTSLKKARPNVIVCHGLPSLLPCTVYAILNRQKIIYDAHELETAANKYPNKVVALVARCVEKMCINKVISITTVSLSIVDHYRATYDVETKYLPNAPLEAKSHKSKLALLDVVGGNANDKIILYLGALSPSRGLDVLLPVIGDFPSSVKFIFMGFGSLRDEIIEISDTNKNVYFLPPQPPSALTDIAKQADIGLAFFSPADLSYRYSMPNKIYNYTNAGIHVLLEENSVDMLKYLNSIEYSNYELCSYSSDGLTKGIERLLVRLDGKTSNDGQYVKITTWETYENEFVEAVKRTANINLKTTV